MGTLSNNENPDKMLHKAAFYLGLLCLLKQNQSSEKEVYLYKIITCDPLVYTMDHPDLTVSNFMENFIGLKKFKQKVW